MLVEIGLKSAKEGYRLSDDTLAYRSLDGLRVLSVLVPEGKSTGNIFRTISDRQGVLQAHSDEKPTWVSCPDKPALQALLAEHYECAEGKPDDVEETHYTPNGAPGIDKTKVTEPTVEVITIESAPVVAPNTEAA